MKLIIELLVISLVYGNSNEGYRDPCAPLAGRYIITYEEAMSCYYSLPLSPVTQRQQIDTLKKTLQLYAFLDINRLSPEKYIPSKYNLLEKLNKLSNKTYTGGFGFYNDIVTTFLGNYDGHTSYTSNCFEQFIFKQPFPLMSAEITNGRQVIRVISKLLIPQDYQEFWLRYGIDVMKYAGQEVTYINSWNTLEYLEFYGSHSVGISKDYNTRLSLALAQPMYSDGEWGISNGMFAVTDLAPALSAISYKFKSGESIRVPYLVTVPEKFKPGMDYYNTFCKPETSEKSKSYTDSMNGLKDKSKTDIEVDYFSEFDTGDDQEDDRLVTMEVPKIVHRRPDTELPILRDFRSLRGIDSPLFASSFVHTYKMKHDVGVLAVSSFSSSNIKLFYTQLQSALDSVSEFRNLILDVSNNGGGVVCFGYHLLDILTGTNLRFPTDFKSSNLLKLLVQKSQGIHSFMDPYYWRRPDFTNFTVANEFLTERAMFRGPNSNSKYSQLFVDNCPKNPLILKKKFDIKNLAVVSNGICFSTCTLVVNGLQEWFGVKSYVVGGDQTKKATVASLAGGTVYSLSNLLKLLKKHQLSYHPDAPVPLALEAQFTFTAREAYSHYPPTNPQHYGHQYGNLTNPLEFTWLPATYHLPSTNVSFYDPSEVWRYIAKRFIN